jgi:hypothetical protein
LWYQRITRGFSDDETWALDSTIIQFTLPRLKRFREITIAYPAGMTPEEWDEILGKMIKAMEDHYNEAELDCGTREERNKLYAETQEGFELFGKYFLALWW